MTLEDRLRRGFDAHHADTTAQLGGPGALPAFTPRPRSLAGPVTSMTIVLVVLAVVGGLLLRDSGRTVVEENLDPALETVIETTTTSAPPVTTADAAPPLVATTEPDPPVDSETTASTAAPSSQPTSAPTTSPTESTAPPTTAGPTTAPTTVASTEPAQSVVSYAAIANTECASGFRAPLEQASLRYLGPNQGWDRLDDLVDEQDGPFYFEAWEPNYPNDVTVEITLLEPVHVTEIMVAQDPYTPVSGDIDIDSVVAAGAIQLSGTEGWRGLDFPSNSLLSSFTIRRDAPEENIMEVMVCVVDPAN